MAYRFTDDFIDRLRDSNDIESVIAGYIDLRRRGKTLTGLCPFHNEKTPSFTVYPENGHNAWTDTYSNPELYRWFLSHEKAQEAPVTGDDFSDPKIYG